MEKVSEGLRQYNFINSDIDATYHRLNVKLGISDAVSFILYTLNENPDASQSEIVRQTGLSKQTVNSAVKKMIAQGLFEPMRGLRNESLILTPKGKKFMDEKISVIVRIENSIFNSWNEEERKWFTQMNEDYLRKLKKAVSDLYRRNL